MALKQEILDQKESMEKMEAEIQRLRHLGSQRRKWQPGSFSTRVLEEELKAKESILVFKVTLMPRV